MQGMKSLWFIIFFLAAPLQSEIVDRVVAVVDGRVITWSAAVAEANCQAFASGQPPVTALEGEALAAVVSHLIDQELLEREARNASFSPPEQGDARAWDEMRKRFPAATEFQTELRRYHLTEAEWDQHLLRQKDILAFVEYHERPQTHVAPGDIETYYRETLLPELRRQGQSNAPPLDQVSGDIEQILTEQQINRRLDLWLQKMRSRAKIRMIAVTSEP